MRRVVGAEEKLDMTQQRFGWRASRLSGDASSAWAVQDEAAALESAGETVIFLSIGDPDQATPSWIVERAVDALRQGRTHYSAVPGEPGARAAVARKVSRESGRPADADQVVIFPGAHSALYAVMATLTGPGEEIIVAEPFYATYPGVVAASGATLVPAPASAADGFGFSVSAILERITTRTKAVLFSNPSNPTGSTVGVPALQALAALSRERGIWLIADEVYSNLVYDAPHVSAWSIGDPDWTVVINSLSKTYAMTGWRLGWAVGPADLCGHLANLAAASQFGCAQFIQDTATFALDQEGPEPRSMREEYRRRRDCVLRRTGLIPGLRAVSPAGGMFVMIDVRAVHADDVAFAFALLRHARVAVIPGSGFGPSAQGHVRVSLTQPISVLEQAFDAIAGFVDRARRNEVTFE